jgi:hypothetical protein
LDVRVKIIEDVKNGMVEDMIILKKIIEWVGKKKNELIDGIKMVINMKMGRWMK